MFKELSRPFRPVLVDCITHVFGFDLLQAHCRAEWHSLLGTISICAIGRHHRTAFHLAARHCRRAGCATFGPLRNKLLKFS